MASIRVVVFDFDGTLVLSNRVKHDAFHLTVDRFGIARAQVDAIRRAEPHANRYRVFAAVAEAASHGEQQKDRLAGELVASYAEIVTRAIAACPETPGAAAALDQLTARKLTLFVNSATPTDGLKAAVDARGMHGWFTDILGGPSSKKDNLAAIREATGVLASQIVMVGDGDDDRQGALDFGCHFVGVFIDDATRGRPVQTLCQDKCTHVISDLRALSSIIDSLSGPASNGSVDLSELPDVRR